MTKLTLNYYQDPSHGWVKVPITLLKQLGIEQDISHYSYMRNNYAYLEEDCDLSRLLKALDSNGILWRLREYNSNKQSKIRSYDNYFYKPDFVTWLKDNDKLQFITVGV